MPSNTVMITKTSVVWPRYYIEHACMHGKILVVEKSTNLVNREPSANIFLTDTWKAYMAYTLTVAYLPNFSLPIAFTCMVHQTFSLPKISRVQYYN